MIIGFAGLSHLGICSSVAAAAKGHRAIGYAPDADLCARLSAVDPPIVEPELKSLMQEHRERLEYTADASRLAECELVYVALDVAADAGGNADLAPLNGLLDELATVLSPEVCVVVLSQVPPGFMRRLHARLATAWGREPVALLYQVETLIFGRAMERALQPERFIVGADDPSQPLPAPLHSFLGTFGCPVLPMRYESAELCKIAINMFLASTLSTTSLLAAISERTGADWAEIAPALRLDRRIGPYAYLTPGLGIGGGNIPRDMTAIAQMAGREGIDDVIVRSWFSMSAERRAWPASVLREHGDLNAGEPVAVWGIAYKENTSTVLNSPAVALMESMSELAYRGYDPAAKLAAPPAAFVACATAIEACEGACALMILTPWPEFAEIEPADIAARLAGDLVVDPYGLFDGAAMRAAGLRHARLGAPVGS